MYMQARPFGAPPGAAGPPPAPVLWLLTRLHPKMRARVKQAKKAFDEKLWRADLKEWDTVDRPEIVAKHRAIEAVDVEFLADEQLAAHINTAFEHLKFSHWMHHKYTAPSTIVVGDLLAGVMEWTGLEGGEVLALIRGNSQVTLGFAAAELTTRPPRSVEPRRRGTSWPTPAMRRRSRQARRPSGCRRRGRRVLGRGPVPRHGLRRVRQERR